MKQVFLLLFVMISIISCEKNDSDLDNALSDPIIGKWQTKSIIVNGVDLITECEKQTTLTFHPSGSLSGISYMVDIGKRCYKKKEETTWQNNIDDNYTIDGTIIDIIFSEKNTVCKMIVVSENRDYDGVFRRLGNVYIFKKK
jgi:hypothetical protein